MLASFIVHPFLCLQRHPSASTSHKSRTRKSKERDGGVGSTVALNRLLFHSSEVSDASEVSLPAEDYRAAHISDVLHLPQDGGTVRAAVIGGLMYDDAQVSIQQDKSVYVSLSSSARIFEPPPPPPVSLILALPRPKVLARLLPQVAAVGVSHIVLCNAYKVERCYFDSSIIRNAEEAEDLLVEGISQCAVDSSLPKLLVEKRLKVFLEDRLLDVSPAHSNRLVAHPDSSQTRTLHSVRPDEMSSPPHVTLAIGPEGGWMPREVSMLKGFGFETVSLGSRILRTDAACLVLLGLVHDFIQEHQHKENT